MEHSSEILRSAVIVALETEAKRVATRRHLGQFIQEETGWYYKAVARIAGEMSRRVRALDLADLPPVEAAERIRAAVSGHDDPFGWGGNWSDSIHDNAVGHLRSLVEKALTPGAGKGGLASSREMSLTLTDEPFGAREPSK